ncbi:putative glutathione-specific gamma-glutamylcyclotransferase 2 [Daktulosphaira vitifoliae]|uniref:putative glutathione-specific gamma-glutamylcyclotransferase 2 n=1 Tax=Daktulosphaira vitifoliae TaxID=58002 RepID=UPI0021A9BD20|nr:putative glutathione-specific gamma-glutamylcyclotransferase 2 [Daktulosphaira vitifoliae]
MTMTKIKNSLNTEAVIDESVFENTDNTVWLFGYGSILWKTNFKFVKECVGYIKGYKRRFYQYSPDHRGTIEFPGRVVTLLPSRNESQVWGVAYAISNQNIKEVYEKLDFREQAGYMKYIVPFYSKIKEDVAPKEVIVYVADEKNKWFAGKATIYQIASRIMLCQGVSGLNSEYVYKLADAMRKKAPDANDKHLFELENILKCLEKRQTVTV